MKLLLATAIATLMLSSCNSNQKKEVPINEPQNIEAMTKLEKEKIEALLDTYKNALGNADAQLATSLFTKDGAFMPSGAPSANGSDDIQKSYEYIFSQIKIAIDFYIDEIVVEGDMAYLTSTSSGTATIQATGETIPEENRELFVFEKIEGYWKIARYMFNKTK